jgi:hypothetical protein
MSDIKMDREGGIENEYLRIEMVNGSIRGFHEFYQDLLKPRASQAEGIPINIVSSKNWLCIKGSIE